MKSAAILFPVALLAPFQAFAATPATATGSAALAMFAGRWQLHGSFMAFGAKKPTHVTGVNDCKWSSDRHLFLVCNGVAHIEGVAAPQYQLSVYTYDAASGKYRFAGITTDADVASPDLGLQGKTWSYSGSFTDKAGKKHWFRTLNVFDSPDRYRYEIQNSGDGVHWTTTGSGVSERR